MGRSILAVIAGYLIMAIFIFVMLCGAYLKLGVEGAYAEGTYEPSALWLFAMFLTAIFAALLGGRVCTNIAPRPKPLIALVVLVLVLGALSAVAGVGAENPGPREGDVGLLEAMTKNAPPLWVALVNPLIGAIGVWIGGSWRLRALREAA